MNFFVNVLVIIIPEDYTSLYEGFTLFEFLFFTGFCYTQVQNKNARLFIFSGSLFFTFFFLIYTLLIKGVDRFDSVPIGIETIIILGFSFYYLYERMNDTNTLFIYHKPAFWIILGIVLYLAGNFFIYIFASYLTQLQIKKYWIITNLFAILKNIFFCIAIYIHARPPKDSLPYDMELSSLN